MFPPVKIGNFLYVDGGVLDNFPVEPIENKCNVLIGSFVNQVGYVEKVSGLITLAERTFMLSMTKEIHEKARKFDLCVSPEELKNYKILNTLKAAELFEVGYEATKEKLKEFDLEELMARNLPG
jgi:NTE family protein